MRADDVSSHYGQLVPVASGEWLQRSHPAMNGGPRHPSKNPGALPWVLHWKLQWTKKED